MDLRDDASAPTVEAGLFGYGIVKIDFIVFAVMSTAMCIQSLSSFLFTLYVWRRDGRIYKRR
ncbi:hypothetical protein K504DRAFT_462022 [Pleomassaria siparia CBS 279.74]|uniref:Uncharacterized protein n=1 Tax=Pleomassaria siparia CBS 279.74 TaxID=1314801 RepID=A0A6G1KKT1_9PLEO|nr:hypothetical protein K504DRAFT_462022 [Pleomassaria siparia CBS 279.74]